MYTPAPFAEAHRHVLEAFLWEYPLALLVSTSASGEPAATHVPMLLDPSTGVNGTLRCHVARTNPHWQLLDPHRAVLAVFGGPEHYVTPSWYESKKEHGKVVPTWNYTAVHVYGTPRTFEEREPLIAHLREMTAAHEARFETPWRLEDAPAAYIDNLTKAIIGIEITITRFEGKWKLSQNRTVADQEGVIAGLETLNTPRSNATAAAMKHLADRAPVDE